MRKLMRRQQNDKKNIKDKKKKLEKYQTKIKE